MSDVRKQVSQISTRLQTAGSTFLFTPRFSAVTTTAPGIYQPFQRLTLETVETVSLIRYTCDHLAEARGE
jgi:hypothetical protein